MSNIYDIPNMFGQSFQFASSWPNCQVIYVCVFGYICVCFFIYICIYEYVCMFWCICVWVFLYVLYNIAYIFCSNTSSYISVCAYFDIDMIE